MDWTTILLYVLGTFLFTLMMLFPDKRDWIHLEDSKKKDVKEHKEETNQGSKNRKK